MRSIKQYAFHSRLNHPRRLKISIYPSDHLDGCYSPGFKVIYKFSHILAGKNYCLKHLFHDELCPCFTIRALVI